MNRGHGLQAARIGHFVLVLLDRVFCLDLGLGGQLDGRGIIALVRRFLGLFGE